MVHEFRVESNAYSAEYGRNYGGQINVITKSGTNEFHGSVFYFYTDESWAEDIPATPVEEFRDPNAEDTEPDEFKRENWGLTAGGPISRDKAHFFFSYDHTKRTSPFLEDLRTRGAYDAVLQRAQTEPESPPARVGQFPGGRRGHHRASRKRDRDPGSEVDPGGRQRRGEQRQEWFPIQPFAPPASGARHARSYIARCLFR